MADERQPSDIDNEDELLLTEEVEQEKDPAEPEADDEDEEEVITFGDDAEVQDDDTSLVKHLRKTLKEAQAELAEARKAPKDEPVDIGPKPDLYEDCEGDPEKFEAALDDWKERKRKAEDRTRQSTDAEEAERAAWAQELTRVETEKLQLGADDAEDAFETVRSALNTMQQAVIVKATDVGNTARLIYALAKHPAKLAELADIQDPLRLAAKVAKLEGQLRVVKKRRAPDPDVPEKGSGRVSHQSGDKTLKKLEEQADRTGDRTELLAYRRKQKAAQKQAR